MVERPFLGACSLHQKPKLNLLGIWLAVVELLKVLERSQPQVPSQNLS